LKVSIVAEDREIRRLGVLFGPGGKEFAIGDEYGDEVRLAVAVDHGLVDFGLEGQCRLDALRGDVVAAAADDNIFLAIGDPNEAIVVDLTDVAGVDPAIAQGLGGGIGIVPVPVHRQLAANQYFAVVGYFYIDTWKRTANGSYADIVDGAATDNGCGFGLSIALQKADAKG